MCPQLPDSGETPDWQQIEAGVDRLIERNRLLAQENAALKARQEKLTRERAELIRAKEMAIAQVSGMIEQLKARLRQGRGERRDG